MASLGQMESRNSVAYTVGAVFAILPAMAAQGYLSVLIPLPLAYVLAGVGCAAAGAFCKVEQLLKFVYVVCGAIAGVGAVLALSMFLGSYTSVPRMGIVVVALAGASPGLIIGWIVTSSRREHGY